MGGALSAAHIMGVAWVELCQLLISWVWHGWGSVSCSYHGVAWVELSAAHIMGVAWVGLFQLLISWVWHGWSSCQLLISWVWHGWALSALSPTTPAILFDYLQELTSRQRRWMLGRRGSSFRSGIQLARRDITPFGRGSTEEPRCVRVCACLCRRVWAGVLDSS